MTQVAAARLAAVSLDCPDPHVLAEFYLALLGGRRLWTKPSSIGIDVGGPVLVAQRVEAYVPPLWPGSSVVHLDLTADDIDAVVQRAVSLGAVLPEQPDPRWRVLLDPAGHPFCITPFTADEALGQLSAGERSSRH